MTSLARANILALAVPALLMAGALGSQYLGGLYPCEMCHWQRWPHYAAIALALLGFATKPPARNVAVALAALAILTSGATGVFHAGVEYHWWAGPPCSSTAAGASLDDIMRAPLIRCDMPQWTLGPISLAGFNAIFSILGGLAVLAMVRKAR
ncbi:disulfide bond formation protein B [Sphingomonas sp. SUN039]|uniref:disulfide bond formation protein B n=1 Tax=Sphingomonas sp. SUN039 TaxID=2937787 RepID=UPI0021641596|nr:disulfide bond formation protein B [Sphingomonas sp. SUN039]UVO54937.1 disulfide bond formation protein B [Sphingomonas sp. SUN039]